MSEHSQEGCTNGNITILYVVRVPFVWACALYVGVYQFETAS